jgi:hypothetical protein
LGRSKICNESRSEIEAVAKSGGEERVVGATLTEVPLCG